MIHYWLGCAKRIGKQTIQSDLDSIIVSFRKGLKTDNSEQWKAHCLTIIFRNNGDKWFSFFGLPRAQLSTLVLTLMLIIIFWKIDTCHDRKCSGCGVFEEVRDYVCRRCGIKFVKIMLRGSCPQSDTTVVLMKKWLSKGEGTNILSNKLNMWRNRDAIPDQGLYPKC